MFCVVASDTLEIRLAYPVSLVLVMTLWAFDARPGGIDPSEYQARTRASVFDERLDLAQSNTKQRFIESAFGCLSIG
jgi:hypothetical protein